MSRHLRWLLWVPLALICALGVQTSASAQGEPIKPYIVFIVDNSGSMAAVTGFGPPSCPGSVDTRMDHAKCAVQNIANSYGDMVVALARFRVTSTDTDCSDGCTVSNVSCSACNGSGAGCTPALRSPDQFQLLVPLLPDGAQSDLVNWTDFACGQCTTTGAEPELRAVTWTPLAGSMSGARRYWQGQDPDWTTGTGSDPVDEDPLNTVFTSPGNQCRPYITVLLTDGEETCAEFTPHTVPAAAALLSTPVDIGTPGTPDVRNYRIETKPIGFGINPSPATNDQIEAIAHAGGEPNDGLDSTLEGAYAQNEEELQLEISAIIADAIKFELCNEEDDDCDILVDEDFPEIDDPCNNGLLGVCRREGTFQCNGTETGTECVLGPPGGTSGDETCDGEDDDCDGFIDEGACVGCGSVELCNNVDDNCNGQTDENLTQPCGTDVGVCSPGTETCVAGDWINCDATGGTAEVCNALDDDCDGTVNGFPEACTNLPSGDPADNPNMGPCHPGQHVCLTDGSGGYGPCTGEVLPQTEVCDTIDNNCNGQIDEGTGGADCSTTCGIGVTECVDGTLECTSMKDIDDETCNNIDDNCNGLIDEDAPSMGPCDDGGLICNGELLCLGGSYVCVGEGVEPETCNCEDDNCNTLIDDGNLCGSGASCVDPSPAGFACQCAQPCAGGEFPCPIGRVCIDNFCLVDPCAGVNCTPDGNGDLTECIGGACQPVCDSVTCPSPLICFGPTGECSPDDCTTFPDRCAADELCVGGTCTSDPCAGVSCDGDQYCFDGGCVASCAGIDCPAGERCELGGCEPDPCGAPCGGNDFCHEASGECRPNPCPNQMCPGGLVCNPQTVVCEQDPCLGVTCPTDDQVCVDGSCFAPDDLVDAGVDADTEKELITAGGGGGCQTDGRGGGGAALLVLALALAVRRRGRREVVS